MTATISNKVDKSGGCQLFTSIKPPAKRNKKGNPGKRNSIGVSSRMKGHLRIFSNASEKFFEKSSSFTDQYHSDNFERWRKAEGYYFKNDLGELGSQSKENQLEVYKALYSWENGRSLFGEDGYKGRFLTNTTQSSDQAYKNGITANSQELKYAVNLLARRIARGKASEAGFPGCSRNWLYAYVIERQPNNKYLNYHSHLYTPECILPIRPGETPAAHLFRERQFVNRVWNEIRAGQCLKKGAVSERQCEKWLSEIEREERYQVKLWNWKAKVFKGVKAAKPKAPKTKYLERPNLKPVSRAHKIGGYLTKYITKGKDEVEGNSACISRCGQILTKRETELYDCLSKENGNGIIREIAAAATMDGHECKIYEIEFNKCLVLLGLDAITARYYLKQYVRAGDIQRIKVRGPVNPRMN